jgi:hypothetical protein
MLTNFNLVQPPGPSDKINVVASPTSDNVSHKCVTIFGFPPDSASAILTHFSNIGTIAQYNLAGNSNWMILEYENELSAQMALSKNGTIFGDIMVGVVPSKQTHFRGDVSSNQSLSTIISPIRSSKTPFKSQTKSLGIGVDPFAHQSPMSVDATPIRYQNLLAPAQPLIDETPKIINPTHLNNNSAFFQQTPIHHPQMYPTTPKFYSSNQIPPSGPLRDSSLQQPYLPQQFIPTPFHSSNNNMVSSNFQNASQSQFLQTPSTFSGHLMSPLFGEQQAIIGGSSKTNAIDSTPKPRSFINERYQPDSSKILQTPNVNSNHNNVMYKNATVPGTDSRMPRVMEATASLNSEGKPSSVVTRVLESMFGW